MTVTYTDEEWRAANERLTWERDAATQRAEENVRDYEADTRRISGQHEHIERLERQLIDADLARGNVECERDRLRVEVEAMIREAHRLRERRDELRAALEHYGRHLGECEGEYDALALGPCTCGLEKALRGEK